MHRISEDIQPLSKTLEWSEDVLNIADPYFLYYLRCSNRLAKLQRFGSSSVGLTILMKRLAHAKVRPPEASERIG